MRKRTISRNMDRRKRMYMAEERWTLSLARYALDKWPRTPRAWKRRLVWVPGAL